MLQKNAIEKASYHPNEFVSSLFLVPKKAGDMRPVINFKPLNEFILKEKFRMETLNAALKLTRKGDYLASLDLKDAYFSIPIGHSGKSPQVSQVYLEEPKISVLLSSLRTNFSATDIHKSFETSSGQFKKTRHQDRHI